MLGDPGSSLTPRSLGFLVCELGLPALVVESAIGRTAWGKGAKRTKGTCHANAQRALVFANDSFIPAPRGQLRSGPTGTAGATAVPPAVSSQAGPRL